MPREYVFKKEVIAFRCLRCSHEWIPKASMKELVTEVKKKPRICPNCKSAYWDLERKNKRRQK